jgi:hypothetical protein
MTDDIPKNDQYEFRDRIRAFVLRITSIQLIFCRKYYLLRLRRKSWQLAILEKILFDDNCCVFCCSSSTSLFDVKMENCGRRPSMLHLFLIFAYLPSSVLAKLLFPDGKQFLISLLIMLHFIVINNNHLIIYCNHICHQCLNMKCKNPVVLGSIL